MNAIGFILLGIVCAVNAIGWRREMLARKKVDDALIKKSADFEWLNQKHAERAILLHNLTIDLREARVDAERLARLMRVHITDMDKVAQLMGGKDDGVVMKEEREALRRHDELNSQPPISCPKN